MNFGEIFFSFLGKCLVMLSMTSMTASYATDGHCQSNSIVYKAGVSSTDDDFIKEYIGMTSNEFKDRYRNHQNSFNDAEYEKETELSKYIWDFKRKQRRF